MITLIDTSLWVDFLRPRSSVRLKEFVSGYILDSTAHVAEPIVFELLRNALPTEVPLLMRRFEHLNCLPAPEDLWRKAAQLGQACRRQGNALGAMDLLIGALAQSHNAVLVTLDQDFEAIGEAGGFRVELLQRPAG